MPRSKETAAVKVPAAETANAAPLAGAELSIEQLSALLEEKRKSKGQPLLDELKKRESEVESIRKQLRALGVKAPPRIKVDVNEEHEDVALLALFNSKGKVNLKEWAETCGFNPARMTALRDALNDKNAENPDPYISEKQGSGLQTIVTLTEKGRAYIVGLTPEQRAAAQAVLDEVAEARKEAEAKAKN
jgi:DNA-binding MarR family transcriptional regulator